MANGIISTGHIEVALAKYIKDNWSYSNRLYPDIDPETAWHNDETGRALYPLCVYDETETDWEIVFAGKSGWVECKLTYECRGLTKVDAKKMAQQIQDILDTVPRRSLINGIFQEYIDTSRTTGDFVKPTKDHEIGYYRVTVDVVFRAVSRFSTTP